VDPSRALQGILAGTVVGSLQRLWHMAALTAGAENEAAFRRNRAARLGTRYPGLRALRADCLGTRDAAVAAYQALQVLTAALPRSMWFELSVWRLRGTRTTQRRP